MRAIILRRVVPLMLVLGIALTLISPPGVPWHKDVDLSYGAMLNYAHQHRLQFGTDIVCTYGPLGFLIFPFFESHSAAARLTADVLICLAGAMGLCLVALRLRLLWRCLLLGLFVWAAANVESRTDLMLESGLFCWGLLCFGSSGRRLGWSVALFAVLASFSLLAKGSFLLSTAVSLMLIATDLVARRKHVVAVALMLGYGFGLVCGWKLSGQYLTNLGSFLLNELSVIQAYNQALGLEGMPLASESAFALFLFLLIVVMLRALSSQLWFVAKEEKGSTATTISGARSGALQVRRFLLFAWTAFMAFGSWKHGFVRFDADHAMAFFASVPLLALGLGIFNNAERIDRPRCEQDGASSDTIHAREQPARGRPLETLARALGLLCAMLSLAFAQWVFFPPIFSSLTQPWQSLKYNFGSLVNFSAYKRQMNELLDQKREQGQLPQLREIIGQATVDVFGQFQAHALWNHLNYTPRPIGQSYVACNRQLMSLNEQFFLSKRAPEYVLFDLLALDHKFPALEDGWLLRDLLINYDLVAREGRFGLLKSKSRQAPRLTQVREGEVLVGQPVDLSPYHQEALWLEVEVRPTLAGWVRQLLYRPSVIRLALWQDDAASSPITRHPSLILRNRAPASMLSAGFVVSPLLARNEDVFGLYGTNSMTRPSMFSVELSEGGEKYWKPQLRFRIYKIENQIGAR